MIIIGPHSQMICILLLRYVFFLDLFFLRSAGCSLSFSRLEGRMVVENRLVAVSKAEDHDHSSQNSEIIAELIRIELKPEIIKNPELSISED